MRKLILIDDHKMLKKGIETYLSENSDWTVCGEAENLDEVEPMLSTLDVLPDDSVVAVVDLQLKGDGKNALASNGFEAAKILLNHNIPSVIFSSNDTGACIEKAMSAEVGAKGFVSKCSDERMLLDAINMVAVGKTFIQPDLVASFLETRSLFAMLTKREQEVVKLIETDITNEEISDSLGIKITTLENYISIIYDKLGCRDRDSLLEKLHQ